MLTELGRRVVDLSWELQQIENLKKKNQTELKNTQGGINSRLEDAKEWISDLEDKVGENKLNSKEENNFKICEQVKGPLGQ